jgi:hypothetical protein
MADFEETEDEGEDSSAREMIVLENDSVVLPDGIYQFEVRYGSAFIYEVDQEQSTELVAVEAGYLADGDYGTVVSQGGVVGSFDVVGNSQVESLDEEPAAWTDSAA